MFRQKVEEKHPDQKFIEVNTKTSYLLLVVLFQELIELLESD